MSDQDPGAPRPLSDSLDRVVAGLGDDRRRSPAAGRTPGRSGEGRGRPADASRGASGVFARWEELVGSTIAAHTRPVRMQDGRLVVVTGDPAWAAQLGWLESDLLKRIAEAGGPHLEGLVVRVRRP